MKYAAPACALGAALFFALALIIGVVMNHLENWRPLIGPADRHLAFHGLRFQA